MKKIFLFFLVLAACAAKAQNSSSPFVCGKSIVVDIDGNKYNTVQIGNQCWLKENLNTSHYCDGSVIPNVTDKTAWGDLSAGAFCWYNNDSATYNNVYGKLYNWYAVSNKRKLAPVGWHVASDSEWNIMEIFIDNTVDTTFSGNWTGADIGSKLKTTSGWNSGGNGTDSSGYSAFPGGIRHGDGAFNWVGGYGGWWSATEYDATNALLRSLNGNNSQVSRSNDYKEYGLSVRCVRDLN